MMGGEGEQQEDNPRKAIGQCTQPIISRAQSVGGVFAQKLIGYLEGGSKLKSTINYTHTHTHAHSHNDVVVGLRLWGGSPGEGSIHLRSIQHDRRKICKAAWLLAFLRVHSATLCCNLHTQSVIG